MQHAVQLHQEANLGCSVQRRDPETSRGPEMDWPLGNGKVVVKSFHDIFTLLTEVENTRGLGAEVRVKATGLLRAITLHSFLFIAHLVKKLLSLFELPNRLLQAEDMDLFTAVTLVNSASDCVKTLRTLCTVGSLSSSSHGHRGCAGDRPRSKQEKTHN